MKHSGNGSAFVCLSALLILAGAGTLMAVDVPSGWSFALPPGDAAAGEKVFTDMKCWSCHRVSGREFGKLDDNPGLIGPNLTAEHGKLPREYLAESIVNYDRWKAHGRYSIHFRTPDGTSRMGNYAEAMTLRQMIDVVEFMKSLR